MALGLLCYGCYGKLPEVIYLTLNYMWRNDFFPTQGHPGIAAHDPTRRTNERVRADTSAADLTLQTTAIRSETRKRMQQQAKSGTQQPLLRGADMQSSQE